MGAAREKIGRLYICLVSYCIFDRSISNITNVKTSTTWFMPHRLTAITVVDQLAGKRGRVGENTFAFYLVYGNGFHKTCHLGSLLVFLYSRIQVEVEVFYLIWLERLVVTEKYRSRFGKLLSRVEIDTFGKRIFSPFRRSAANSAYLAFLK